MGRERGIEVELDKLRIRDEARRRLEDENRPPVAVPPVRGLTALLAEPDMPARYRIDRLAPVDARIILSAQYKAGKTILVGNLLRSLADGHPFLGRFNVNTPARRVVLIDDELSENTLRPWLRDQGIINTDAVVDVVALRGKVAAFNLLDDRRRDEWAARLRDLECDYLILDCLRPVLDSLGLDENHDAGRFLVAYDALLEEAGVADSTLLQHMGHANERARGDSRLQDWPDAIWRMIREDDNPDSPRFFTAYGRDVDVPEGRLRFDPQTRRLTYSAGSRGDAKTEAAMVAMIAVLAEHAQEDDGKGLSGNTLEMRTAGGGEHTRKAIRAGIAKAIERNLVEILPTRGPHGAKMHRLTHPCEECGRPVTGGGSRHLSCPPEDADPMEGLF